MTAISNGDAVSDDILTAYLDDELDPATREEVERRLRTEPRLKHRLDMLAGGVIGLRPALDHLLEAAPRERLEALVANASLPHPAAPGPRRARWWLLALAASILLVVGGVGGFVVGHAPPDFLAHMFAWRAWEETIARQVSLYNRASLEAIHVDQAEQYARLDRLAAALDLDLSASKVALPGLALKRVEQLQIDGHLLAQLLYASDDLGPVALCIIKESEKAGEHDSRRVAGMTLVYWSAGVHGFLLVGRAPAEKMQKLAEAAARIFSG